MTEVTRIDAWETSDGRLFKDEVWARDHQRRLDETVEFNRLFDAGASIAECLEHIGLMQYWEMHRDVLSLITSDRGISIPHWQGRDQAGYSVVHRMDDGRYWVGGDAGSWSGDYAAPMSLSDLVYHARYTMARHGGKLPEIWRRG